MQHAINDPIRSHQFEQFQEKCEAVFRPELHKNKKLKQLAASVNGELLQL